MRLRDLGARFLKISGDVWLCEGVKLADADGIMFQCPKCCEGKERAPNDRFIGAHSVVCWFVGKVPDDLSPLGRWNPQGTGIDDLTFVGPGAVSVLLKSGCGWHGFVKNGDAT